MKFSELKAMHGGGRMGVVYNDTAKRIVFFRQPKSDEFQAMQLLDTNDKDATRIANEDYVLGCAVATAPIPRKEPHDAEDFEIVLEKEEPWLDRIIAAEGPAVVSVAWIKCVNELGGGGAKRTRFF